jgi:hypothetical protein
LIAGLLATSSQTDDDCNDFVEDRLKAVGKVPCETLPTAGHGKCGSAISPHYYGFEVDLSNVSRADAKCALHASSTIATLRLSKASI